VTPLGHRLHFVFREGLLVQVSDYIGRTVCYHYEDGLLAEVVNPTGGSIRYRYSGEGMLITASDCAGSAYLVNEYDSRGRVIRQVLGDQEVATLEYRDDRKETAVHTRYGTAVFQYSRMKLPVRTYASGTTGTTAAFTRRIAGGMRISVPMMKRQGPPATETPPPWKPFMSTAGPGTWCGSGTARAGRPGMSMTGTTR